MISNMISYIYLLTVYARVSEQPPNFLRHSLPIQSIAGMTMTEKWISTTSVTLPIKALCDIIPCIILYN